MTMIKAFIAKKDFLLFSFVSKIRYYLFKIIQDYSHRLFASKDKEE
jgi:hypothetical protein